MTNHLDLLEFIASGRFFGLGTNSSRDDVVAVLGPPDDTGMVSKLQPRGTIFVYGGIELHFGDCDRLAVIHFDYPNLPPAGSDTLSVAPRIVADGLPVAEVLSACADCDIELQHLSDDPKRVFRAQSGVCLTFYDPYDPDRTGLAAVSLPLFDGYP